MANADGNTNAASPDVINFSVSGAITLNSIAGALSIQGPGASSLSVALAAVQNGTNLADFQVASGESASVSGLTIAGLNAEAIVLGAGSNLVAQGVTFRAFGTLSSSGYANAGILANQGGGSTLVTGCTFASGFATPIYDVGDASLTVANSTFSGNVSQVGAGGLFVAASATGQGGAVSVTDSLFTRNDSSFESTITLGAGASGTVADSTFSSNQAGGFGGAIILHAGFGPSGGGRSSR